MSDHAVQFEVENLQKSITSIEHNISDIEKEYDKQMSELAEEKNYDPWFYAGIAFGFLWFLYKLFSASLTTAFFSFVILVILCGVFFAYKKLLNKEIRVAEIKEEFDKKMNEQQEILAKRQAELGKFQ